ncbi:hypothetical protein HZC27_00030 [Candidatus Roizmanbacteria bacterium]|nr:hypothetical protein [Candidatus Roizmanbacteria bacterium]
MKYKIYALSILMMFSSIVTVYFYNKYEQISILLNKSQTLAKDLQNQLVMEKEKNNILEQQIKSQAFYKDPTGRFLIRIPHGWEVLHTNYWDAIQVAGSNELNHKIQIIKSIAKDKRSLYEKIKADNDNLYAEIDGYINLVKPYLFKFSYGGKDVVLESCNDITVKGGGYACTKQGPGFRRVIYMDDGHDGYIGLEIFSEVKITDEIDVMSKINLLEWLDRITLLK